jgi:predicted RNA binding protein with dsRBD fold (UPF0201 family)
MPTVTVSAPLHASEDPAKLEAAVRRLFPDARVARAADGMFEAKASSLDSFGEAISKQRIMDAARHELLGGLDEARRSSTFRISKQAAAAGKVSFAVAGSPLGDFGVTVEDSDVEGLLKAIAPRTVKGFPVSEEKAERLAKLEREKRRAKVALAQEAREGRGEG